MSLTKMYLDKGMRINALHSMNVRHDLSTTLMPQTFEGFNDLCTNVHDIEIHSNVRKKSVKESSGKTRCLLATTVNRLPAHCDPRKLMWQSQKQKIDCLSSCSSSRTDLLLKCT